MTSKKDKDVAVKGENLPTSLDSMLEADSALGRENMASKDDFAIPRLNILQSNSPKAIKRTETYVDGAEASMIIENVADGLFDGEQGIVVLPLYYRRTILEWKLRGGDGSGGGFVADHGLKPELLKSCTVDKNGQFINEDGNQLVETAEYYVFMVLEDDVLQPAVISMASSQISKAKRWNTLMDQVRHKGSRVPTFFMSYKLTTIPESNDKGNWFGWSIKKFGSILTFKDPESIYEQCKAFHQQIGDGDVKVADHDSPEDSSSGEGEDNTPL